MLGLKWDAAWLHQLDIFFDGRYIFFVVWKEGKFPSGVEGFAPSIDCHQGRRGTRSSWIVRSSTKASSPSDVGVEGVERGRLSSWGVKG
jgi:hypothetical protein